MFKTVETDNGSGYHVFVEVAAKQAARECGVSDKNVNGNDRNTREMWNELWDKSK
ncbi:hypothetical protein MCHI_002320 [Candidatus Magnetoovum chiemensis]|nr:hypothetical protein MCHI_002320 [Candidatus Magnetoovum chiemensis]